MREENPPPVLPPPPLCPLLGCGVAAVRPPLPSPAVVFCLPPAAALGPAPHGGSHPRGRFCALRHLRASPALSAPRVGAALRIPACPAGPAAPGAPGARLAVGLRGRAAGSCPQPVPRVPRSRAVFHPYAPRVPTSAPPPSSVPRAQTPSPIVAQRCPPRPRPGLPPAEAQRRIPQRLRAAARRGTERSGRAAPGTHCAERRAVRCRPPPVAPRGGRAP